MEKVLVCPLGSQCERINAEKNVVEKCVWHVNMRGTNPTTGQEVDQEGCAMAWMPVLLVENSRQQRSTAAAMESFRNTMADGNNAAQATLMQAVAHLTKPALPLIDDQGKLT